LDISVSSLKGCNNVLNQVSSVLITHDLSVKGSWLGEIAVGVLLRISLNQTGNLERSLSVLLILEGSTEAVRFVVGSGSLVSINNHETISDTVGDSSSVGAVDGDLVVVSTESVSVGIRVGEKSSL